MKNDYRIKYNRQEPSREEVSKHMDFASLLDRHQETAGKVRRLQTFRRWGYRAAAAAAIALAIVAAWPWLNPGARSADPEAFFAQQPCLNPPAAGWKSTPVVNKVNADQGGVIEYPSGSRLVIPAYAFMDDRGQRIGGEVEIHYRELHDYVDFFVDGVPMRYDSNGRAYHLESAGMIEIFALQNGQAVKLNPQNPLQVELVSAIYTQDFFSLPSLLVYQLDTLDRNWQYRQPDAVSWLGGDPSSDDPIALEQHKWEKRLAALEQDRQARIRALEATAPVPDKPVKPEEARGERPTLELDFLSGDIALAPGSDISPSELERLHGKAIWEIAPESAQFDERALQVTWEQVKLRRLEGRNYELTLIHPQNQLTLVVRPALMGDDYRRALAVYERQVLEYESALAARTTQLEAQRQAIEDGFGRQYNELQREFGHFMDGLANEGNLRERLLRRRILHRFTINGTGFWNCARPLAPAAQTATARYVDEQGNAIDNQTAFVVNRGENTVYRYLAAPNAPLALHPDREQLIWVVLPDKELAMARRMPGEEPRDAYTFTLHKTGKQLNTAEEVRRALQFK